MEITETSVLFPYPVHIIDAAQMTLCCDQFHVCLLNKRTGVQHHGFDLFLPLILRTVPGPGLVLRKLFLN